MKTKFKLFVTMLSVAVLAATIQSCSNPLNPESKFHGKWKLVRSIYNGGNVDLSQPQATSIMEFKSDGKLVEWRNDGSFNITSFKVSSENPPVVLVASGEPFVYEFKGNTLTLTYQGGSSMQFFLEKR